MPNLYNVKAAEDGISYTFVTRFNITYHLALISYQLGEVNAFSLSLYPETAHTQIDYQIKNTVIKLISDLLSNDTNIILYVCDTDDGREDERHIVFEYWFKKASPEYPHLKKYNFCVLSENGYQINSSILYNAENMLEEYILTEFKKAMEIS